MDPILRYAILCTCMLLIAMIPYFVIRIYMFTIKSHFLLSKTAQRMSLVTNLLSFILFLGLLIYYTSVVGFMSPSFYVIMVLTFILILLIYKRLDMKPVEDKFIVSYTLPGSKKRLINNLSSDHLIHITTVSTFSYLTHIKYLSLNEEEIQEVQEIVGNVDKVYLSFKGIVAHIYFALFVALTSIAFVSFIVFFNFLII